MAARTPSLSSLAETISQNANALAAKLEEQGLPAPSFAEDGLVDYPKIPDLVGLRMALLDATADMWRLALGPTDTSFMGPLWLNYDATTLDILNEFNFWDAVPLGRSVTYSEVATKVNLPESLVRRVLRYAIHNRLFASAQGMPDSVTHTSLSAAPARNLPLRSWLHHNLRECRPGAVHMVESFRKFNVGQKEPSEEPAESGFATANLDHREELESYWDYMGRDVDDRPKGWRASEFASAMKATSSASAIKVEDLLKIGYDWTKLGEVTVIDVGGSGGHDALCLTGAFPNLKRYIVQDLPELETTFNECISEDQRSRIKFEAHNFFGPQNTKGDVYMLKVILHDWPDKYAAKIIANLLPCIESGARLLLVETIAPSNTAQLPFNTLARLMTGADLQMLELYNSLERSIEGWKALLAKVDDRLKITYVSDVPGSLYNFLEVQFCV